MALNGEKIFICGLGGGLDIVNCLPFYYMLVPNNIVELGSIRPIKKNQIEKKAYSEKYKKYSQITAVDKNSIFHIKGRYAEAKIADVLIIPCTYILSRSAPEGGYDHENLAAELTAFLINEDFTRIIFVDGGGDSMILTPADASNNSQSNDPFSGGDAFALKMIYYLSLPDKFPVRLATVAVGLDINIQRFQENLSFLKEKNIFLGEAEFIEQDNWMKNYFAAAEKILKLSEADTDKIASKTATVLYHALKEQYGVKRTFVSWEGEVLGQKGVEVTEEHRIVYMFDPTDIHSLKLELNNTSGNAEENNK